MKWSFCVKNHCTVIFERIREAIRWATPVPHIHLWQHSIDFFFLPPPPPCLSQHIFRIYTYLIKKKKKYKPVYNCGRSGRTASAGGISHLKKINGARWCSHKTLGGRGHAPIHSRRFTVRGNLRMLPAYTSLESR